MNKKRQRRRHSALSIMLVLAMVFSTISAAFPAYAVEQTANETAAETDLFGETEETEQASENNEETLESETEQESQTDTEETEMTESAESETLEETEGKKKKEKESRKGNADGDELVVYYANASGVFEDVATLGGAAVPFPLSGQTKQIKIFARFGTQTQAADRTLEVEIPRGYKIIEYAAKDDTPVIQGVNKGGLSEEYQAKLESVVLTGLSDTDFTKQKVSGYTGVRSSTEKNVRTYEGNVLYTFNSNVDYIELTLTLGIQQELLPHSNTTYELDPISVQMTNGDRALDEHFTTEVSELVVPTYRGYTIKTEGDIDTGMTSFSTGFSAYLHNSSAGRQEYLVDEATFTVDYPQGAIFKGFNDRYVGVGSVSADHYESAHLTVENDPVARKVTFTYRNIILHHSPTADIYCDWEVDINATGLTTTPWDGSNVTIEFPAVGMNTAGGNIGDSQTYAMSKIKGAEMTGQIETAGWDVRMTSGAKTRADLGMGYKYEYMLGGIQISNPGPSQAKDLTYEWQFDESLAVRAVSFPGSVGDDITDVEVTVKKTDGSEETRTAAGPFVVTATSATIGTYVRAEDLGLQAGEYITTLTAKQKTLGAAVYGLIYSRSAAAYYGNFQNGQTGTATLTVKDKEGAVLANATDTPTIDWTNSGAGAVNTTAVKAEPDGASSFYPTDKVNFTSVYTASDTIKTQNDIVDPTVIISLPTGIELDSNSVVAVSDAGNHGGAEFALELKSFDTISQDGVDWKVYRFSSKKAYDMIANAANMGGNALVSGTLQVKFSANISSSCQAYGGIPMSRLVLWDLGRTADSATSGVNYTVTDTAKRAGKDASYKLAAATQSGNLYVTLKPGLNVSLGIKTTGSSSDYYTYNGDSATIAPLKAGGSAEVYLEYTNTSTVDYYTGTEVYLPIPKAGVAYSGYFNNVANNPYKAENEDNRAPEFDMNLTGPISLTGFTTYYTTDSTGSVEAASTADSWKPVQYSWTTSVSDYADVTMVKFVANDNIKPVNDAKTQGTGFAKFTIAVDGGAGLEEQNFWRSYQKGWTNVNGLGSWIYGSVLAAETAKDGIKGRVFEDKNANGVMDAGEAYDNTAGKITALLEGDAISPMQLTVAADGTFSTDAGYSLKVGNYTVTITNGDSMMGFTTTTSGTRSSSVGWYMDVPQDAIESDHSKAVFGFEVKVGGSLGHEYVGVGLKETSKVTYKAGSGASFTDTEEYVNHNNNIKSAPNLTSANIAAGYDINTQKWSLDKAVKLNDGTSIAAGTKITRAQLYQVKVTESLVATVSLTPMNYTITYNLAGGTATGSNSASYTIETATFTLSNPTRNGYTFAGWTGNGITTPTKSMSVTKGTTGNLTFTANWTPANYTITYNLAGGTAAGSNPTTYTIETADFTLTNPTKAGYTFAGWTGNGITTPTNSMSVTKGTTGNLTFTANWTTDSYTITYNLAGGTATGNNPTTYTTQTATFTLANPTRTGYTFAGWTGNGHATPQQAMSVTKGTTGNLTFTANWTPINYTITYNLDGGTAGGSNPTAYTIETANFTLTNPTKNGYTFVGWTGNGYSTPQQTMTVVKGTTGNLILTANWTINSYNISVSVVNNLGGTAAALPAKVNYDGSSLITAIPSTGYELDYIKVNQAAVTPVTASGISSYTITNIGENKAVTVKFKPITYKVEYNANGGTGTKQTDTITYDDTTAVLKTFTALGYSAPAGYTFQGWGTSAGATTVAYTDGQSISNLTATKGATVSLYAIYTENGNEIHTYQSADENMGTVSPKSQTLKPSTGVATGSSATAKSGYMFAYWKDSNNKIVSYAKKFIPEKVAGLNVTDTYTAYFVKAGAVGGNGQIGANDFAYKLSAGALPIDRDMAVAMAEVVVSGYVHGTTTPQDIDDVTVDSTELAVINDAIANSLKGQYDLTFYTGDYAAGAGSTSKGDKVTIKVTLTKKGTNEFSADDFKYSVMNADSSESADLTEAKALALANAWAKDTALNELSVDADELKAINEAKAKWFTEGLDYSGKTKFDLTLRSPRSGDVVIEVTLYSKVTEGPDGSTLAANNFKYDVIGGAISADQMKAKAAPIWEDAYGNGLDQSKITVVDKDVQEINKAIAARELGDYTLTLQTPDGLEQKITVTLVGTVILVAEDPMYDIGRGQLSEAAVKELVGVSVTDAAGQAVDINDVTLAAGDLDALNKMIEDRKTGPVSITVTAPDGTTKAVSITLYRYDVEASDVTMKISELNGLKTESDVQDHIIKESKAKATKTTGTKVETLGVKADVTNLIGTTIPKGQDSVATKVEVYTEAELARSATKLAQTEITVTVVQDEESESESETESESESTSESESSKETEKATKKGGGNGTTTVYRTGGSASGVKTGDTTQVMWYVAILLGAGVVIAGTVLRKRRQKK